MTSGPCGLRTTTSELLVQFHEPPEPVSVFPATGSDALNLSDTVHFSEGSGDVCGRNPGPPQAKKSRTGLIFMVFLVIIFVVAVLFVFVVIFIVVVFVIIAISLVFTFMGGSHIVDSVVLVFACFVGPVIVVIVVIMYVVCLLSWLLSRRPEIRFLLRLRPPRITMPYGTRRRQKEKRGGVGGNPPLSSSLSPTHNHIPSYSSTPTRAAVLSPINHGQPDIPVGAYSTLLENPHAGERSSKLKNTFTPQLG